MGKTWIFNDGNRSPRTRTTTGEIACLMPMLFGLHLVSSSGHAGQTSCWGDVLGAVPGKGARNAPSLFRACIKGHSDA